MNYTRLALAAVAATIADFVYGFAVYGNLLTGSFLAQPGIYRSAEAQMANMPLGAAAILLAITAAAMLFAVSSFRGLGGGLWFGLLLAVFAIGIRRGRELRHHQHDRGSRLAHDARLAG